MNVPDTCHHHATHQRRHPSQAAQKVVERKVNTTSPSPAATPPATGWLLHLGLLLTALLILRIAALLTSTTDLFFDEAQYWSWSTEPAFGYYSKPPLVAWVIRAATELCGSAEYCIRLPAPLFHTVTALLVYATATRLYDASIGFWSALAYATLPGVSFSAGIISTDVPLLTFWALALYAIVSLERTNAWWPAILLGLALGLGLNAKYAMAYFVLALAIYALWSGRVWRWATDRRLQAALALAALLILPNILWNQANSFATFTHTADNAKWHGQLFHPLKALEFLAAQFGVFGPILFASLLIITWRAIRHPPEQGDKLLLSFTLPVIAVVTIQALVSRAHANWAAIAYVAATILVVATLIRTAGWRWLKLSLGIHVAVLGLLIVATSVAARLSLPNGVIPFARTIGWNEIAKLAEQELQSAAARQKPFKVMLGEERALVAQLLYYMRTQPAAFDIPPILAWRSPGRPMDHYELTRPYAKKSGEPVLLVSLTPDVAHIANRFANVDHLGTHDINVGKIRIRQVRFYALSGFKD